MKKIKIYIITSFLILCIIFLSCSPQEEEKTQRNSSMGIVFFNNMTSFDVNLFQNYIHPSALLCSIKAGSPAHKEILFPSLDQVSGDIFYPQYKILIANEIQTGGNPIYGYMQLDYTNINNIRIVIKGGEIYSETIEQPSISGLRLIDGYIAVVNMRSTQVQIMNGNEVLYKDDGSGIHINTKQPVGYYKFSFYSDLLNITQLKARDSIYMDFPEFTMERGKLCVYWFEINAEGVVSGPTIKFII